MMFTIFCQHTSDAGLAPKDWSNPAFDIQMPIVPMVGERMPFTVNHWPIRCEEFRWDVVADNNPDTAEDSMVMLYEFEDDDRTGDMVTFHFDPELKDEPVQEPKSNVVALFNKD